MTKDDSFDTYFLSDDKQYEKLFIERYDGMNELYRQQYWDMFGCNNMPSNEKIEQEKHELLFSSYDLHFEGGTDSKWVYIYNHCVNIHIPYYKRWWDLCRVFTEHYQDELWNSECFIDYRKSIKYYTQKLGDTKVYFLDDQSDVMNGVGQSAEWDMTWEEIEDHILKNSGNLLLDIPEFITNESYRTKFEKSRDSDQIEYEYPLAFVDNFRDLE